MYHVSFNTSRVTILQIQSIQPMFTSKQTVYVYTISSEIANIPRENRNEQSFENLSARTLRQIWSLE